MNPSADQFANILKGLLSKTGNDELFALDHDLQDLTEHPGWARLIELLAGAEKGALERLMMLDASEGAIYARWLGFISGLGLTAQLPETVAASARRRAESKPKEPISG